MGRGTAIPSRGASPASTAAAVAANASLLVVDTSRFGALRTIRMRTLRGLAAGTGGLQEHRRCGGYLPRFGIRAGSLLPCRGGLYGADNGERVCRGRGHHRRRPGKRLRPEHLRFPNLYRCGYSGGERGGGGGDTKCLAYACEGIYFAHGSGRMPVVPGWRL